jgi:lysophospholipid acyltransferase (LPLAT)-like uncharacterized protein
MNYLTAIKGWVIAIAVLILRSCCRIRLHNDPRAALRASSKPYIYSVLHCHQIATVIQGETGTGAMVSRSDDGELLIPCLRVRGIVPIRGSNRRKTGDKGGLGAIDALVEHVAGGSPGYLAVDGPRGPRNHVHKGIAVLSQRTGAAVVNLVAVPSRRWIFTRAWDRFQIPKPFSTIHGYFGEPIFPQKDESVEQFRKRIETALNDLERKHDSIEFDLAAAATLRRQAAREAANRARQDDWMTESRSTSEHGS